MDSCGRRGACLAQPLEAGPQVDRLVVDRDGPVAALDAWGHCSDVLPGSCPASSSAHPVWYPAAPQSEGALIPLAAAHLRGELPQDVQPLPDGLRADSSAAEARLVFAPAALHQERERRYEALLTDDLDWLSQQEQACLAALPELRLAQVSQRGVSLAS